MSSWYELGTFVDVGASLTASLIYRERRFIAGAAEDLKQADFDLLLCDVARAVILICAISE